MFFKFQNIFLNSRTDKLNFKQAMFAFNNPKWSVIPANIFIGGKRNK